MRRQNLAEESLKPLMEEIHIARMKQPPLDVGDLTAAGEDDQMPVEDDDDDKEASAVDLSILIPEYEELTQEQIDRYEALKAALFASNCPSLVKFKHVGLMYAITEEDRAALFAAVSAGKFNKMLVDWAKAGMTESMPRGILVRPPALEAITQIQHRINTLFPGTPYYAELEKPVDVPPPAGEENVAAAAAAPAAAAAAAAAEGEDILKLDEKRFGVVIDGRPGSGKSMTLNHIAHWALKKNYFVFFVPEVSSWTDDSSDWFQSEVDNLILQRQVATGCLKSLMHLNKDKLEQIPATRPIPPVLQAAADAANTELKTLADIANFGLTYDDEDTHEPNVYAGDYVVQSIGDITQFPVVVVVDEVQGLSGQSNTNIGLKKPLPVSRLALPRRLQDFIRRGIKNGVLVLGNTRTHRFQHRNLSEKTLAQFHQYIIPNFCLEETTSMVFYYELNGQVRISKGVDETLITRMHALSSGNARRLHETVTTLA